MKCNRYIPLLVFPGVNFLTGSRFRSYRRQPLRNWFSLHFLQQTQSCINKNSSNNSLFLSSHFLPETLPDALASGCTKCNEKQKQTAEKVIKHLQVKRSRDWDRLTKKYDPQGEYKKRYDSHVSTAAWLFFVFTVSLLHY